MGRKHGIRMIILLFVCLMLSLALLVRLYLLQIVKGSEYADNFVLKITREIPVKGVRGNIYDRNGKVLARNELVYTVTFADSQSYASERERQLSLNGMIYQIIKIIEAHGDTVLNHLDIKLNEDGAFEYTAEGFWLERFRADVFGKAEIDDMTQDERSITAAELVEFLAGEERFCADSQNGKPYSAQEREKYGLPAVWSEEDLLKVMGIRYQLSLQSFQRYLAVTVAEDVSPEVIAVISESKGELPGVDIGESTIRVYEGGEACASVMGYIGKISAEELAQSEEGTYDINSVIGKSGMEQYLEEYLRGKDGQKQILVDHMGRTVSQMGEIEPLAGQDVYLSIDLELQKAAYEALEKEIANVLLENLINEKRFNNTGLADTTDIRIPVYQVYCAFFQNELLDLDRMEQENASASEREIRERFLRREEEVLETVTRLMLNDTDGFADKEEQRSYEEFIIGQMDLVPEEYGQEALGIIEKWEEGRISLGDYIKELIGQGWLNPELMDEGEEYLSQEEALNAAAAHLREELKGQRGFEKIIYKYMLMNDLISPDEVYEILYEQGALDKEDGDYQMWISGSLSAFDLTLRKLEKLEITPADLALDPCSGSAVVTDVQTGKVLACVSYPGYDNNRFANEIDQEYYRRVSQNESLPLFNRATQQLSAPGSTLKPVTIIAGMQEGVIDFHTSVFCDGVFDKVFPSVKCWNHAGHGEVASVAGALQHSCNDYLCEVSYRLGMMGNEEFSDEQAVTYLRKYEELFDLDKKSGIELAESEPHITDNYGIPSAIGQGTNNFSTVQLGRYANTLANRGNSYQLSLIERIGDQKKEPKLESAVELPEEIWDSVQTGMEWYAQNTGIFDGFPISVAGKSGTAQEMETRPDHGLFIGYAPAEEPEISAAVRIANGYESAPAVSCARDILEAYFRL